MAIWTWSATRADHVRFPVRAGHRGAGQRACPPRSLVQVLAPIDIAAQFGAHPDVDEVNAQVRPVMQKGLDELAAKRRFPVIG